MRFSLESLEYDRLKAVLARYVRSQSARELLDDLLPSADVEGLESRHALVSEAVEYLRDQAAPFPEIPDLRSVLAQLGPRGITLEINEIAAVQEFANDVVGLRGRWGGEARRFPLLSRLVLSLPDLKPLVHLLGRAIRNGEVREEFSPELKRIRRDLETARGRLNQRLRSVVRTADRAGYLQEAIVTIRNGRFVIPVRAEHQRSVRGIVHGSSSSGATVFVEPLETLEMNNDLVRLSEADVREVRRILAELTERIQDYAGDLDSAVASRAGLELVFGIARWARDFDCTSPRFSDGSVYIRNARHPLLDDQLRTLGGAAVPLNLDLEREERVLVISGPNAGGKTVVLKTLGLFALMAQSGIPVPASEARLPVTDRVLADIGDQQSIPNQLSTFSAHVLALSEMAEEATAASLILLDEIGSSTEPSEGAALGISVLEHFRALGSLTVATTHYNRLKMYAETTPGVRNAAMEFNQDTLEPTFALIQGLAGQSSGLRIAKRLGLREDILERAWSRLDTTELDAARFVEDLKQRIAELEHDKARLESERRAFERWKSEVAGQIEAERVSRLAELERLLDRLVADVRRRAEDSLRAVGDRDVGRFTRALDRARSDAEQQLKTEVFRETPGMQDSPGPAPRALVLPPKAGSRVRLRSLGVEGVILGLTSDGADVSVGHMKVHRPLADLDVLEQPSVRLPDHVRFDAVSKEGSSGEINVIGCTRDEAVDQLDKFLDDAFLTGFPSVRIVHGLGKGVLKKAVARFLETHPHVSGFSEAPPEQGGAGVTVAELRQ